jgi:hypothetical protein
MDKCPLLRKGKVSLALSARLGREAIRPGGKQVMGELLLFLLVFFAGLAVLFAGLFTWWVVKVGSVRLALDNAGCQWSATLAVGFGMFALPCAATLLGQQEGRWRLVPLVVINLLMQPLCGVLVAGGCHQFGAGLTGRLTYAFRIIPPEGMEPKKYRRLVRTRMSGGLVTALFFGWLGLVCLWPFWG